MSSQLRTFASALMQRLPHNLFATLFLLYVAGALLWLLLGLASGLAAASTSFYQLLVDWSQSVARDSALAYIIRLLRLSSLYTQPPYYYLFYYLFSVVNLVAALGMVWLRPRDWVARALAVGMVGTAAVFNWPAHAVLDFSAPLINEWHTNYHLISGLAYAIGLTFFPDGTLPDLPFAQRLPWPDVRAGLRIGYVLLLFFLGFGAANVTDGEPPGLVFFFGLVVPLIGIAAQIARYQRATQAEARQQSKVLLLSMLLSLGAGLLLLLIGLLFTLPALGLTLAYERRFEQITFFVFPLIFTTIPLMLFVTVVRYRLWDFDRLINRSLVYGTLTGFVVGVYVVAVGLSSALLQSQEDWLLSMLVTGVVALLFHPLRQWLQQMVNRLMYGQRDEPVQVLHQLRQQLAMTVAPEELLPTIARTITQTLKVPYAAVALQQEETSQVMAEWGKAPALLERLPLAYRHEVLGQLLVAPRRPDEWLTPGDYRLLQEIAHEAGVAIHALRLTLDLQRAREQLVMAREEERRRLRRDLHDGLGPQLATLTLKIDAARNLIAHKPAQADRLLVEYKTQTQAALTDLRRIVHNLRPPALDQLGLLSALRQHLASTQEANLQITLDTPDQLPTLPAAVEVAAYHIVLEALANVIRHAAAQRCIIRLQIVNAQIHLTICDDGKGLSSTDVAGVGLRSMRERAEELGGVFTLGASTSGGTQLTAHLPLVVSAFPKLFVSTKEDAV
ncbi:MAG: sensor histidine kinase [Caldilinea sp. CFX5]|nr:sensor histidine kinase [Caldilinea sp. CFX5]